MDKIAEVSFAVPKDFHMKVSSFHRPGPRCKNATRQNPSLWHRLTTTEKQPVFGVKDNEPCFLKLRSPPKVIVEGYRSFRLAYDWRGHWVACLVMAAMPFCLLAAGGEVAYGVAAGVLFAIVWHLLSVFAGDSAKLPLVRVVAGALWIDNKDPACIGPIVEITAVSIDSLNDPEGLENWTSRLYFKIQTQKDELLIPFLSASFNVEPLGRHLAELLEIPCRAGAGIKVGAELRADISGDKSTRHSTRHR